MRVAIVGAGPAGCAAAVALRGAGAHVFLIGDGRDGVGEQLAPEARPLLERLGLLPLEGHLDCVGVRSAWQTSALAEHDYLFRPFGSGWLLDRRTFGAQLRSRAVAAGVELRQPARITALRRARCWRLSLAAEEIDCDWILDASGRRAEVARRLGVRRRRYDRQFAVVGWVLTRIDDEDATLTVESVDDGWWYSGRLPNRRRIAAWIGSGRPDLSSWETRLRATRHIAPLLRDCRRVGPLVVRPAESSILEQTCGPGWIAVGDAAAAYDPISARGLVAALESGLAAADLVGASDDRLAAHHRELEQRFARYLAQRNALYESSTD